MKRRNFTLMEVIIALGLFVMISLICMTMITSMMNSLESQKKRSKHIQMVTGIDKSVRKMFGNMVEFSWRDEDNQKIPHFFGTMDLVRFVHLNRVNDTDDGGLRFVEIYVDEDQQLVAHYQTRPFLNAEEKSENAYLSVLAEKVESVSFRYASLPENEKTGDTLEWIEEWEDDRLDIPLAMLMTVTWQDENTESFMWRTSANSFYERLRDWKSRDLLRR